MAQLVRRQAPSFNTVQLQHADVEIRLPGGLFSAVDSIGYSAKVINRQEFRGVAPVAGGVTRGGLQYEASLTIYRSARNEFQNLCLSDPSSRGMFDTFIPIIVSFVHPQWDRVETDTLYVMIDSWGFRSSSSPSVLNIDVPLYCGRISFSSGGRVDSQAAEANQQLIAARNGVTTQEANFVPQFVIDLLNEEAL